LLKIRNEGTWSGGLIGVAEFWRRPLIGWVAEC